MATHYNDTRRSEGMPVLGLAALRQFWGCPPTSSQTTQRLRASSWDGRPYAYSARPSGGLGRSHSTRVDHPNYMCCRTQYMRAECGLSTQLSIELALWLHQQGRCKKLNDKLEMPVLGMAARYSHTERSENMPVLGLAALRQFLGCPPTSSRTTQR